MAAEIRRRYPRVRPSLAIASSGCRFPTNFSIALSPSTFSSTCLTCPACIREVYRLINKKSGRFVVVIPTEGSPAYALARKISAQRLWNKHFSVNYAEFYKREHINLPDEIQAELAPYFEYIKRASSRSDAGDWLFLQSLCRAGPAPRERAFVVDLVMAASKSGTGRRSCRCHHPRTGGVETLSLCRSFLDYPVTPAPRWGHGKPPHASFTRSSIGGAQRYRRRLQDIGRAVGMAAGHLHWRIVAMRSAARTARVPHNRFSPLDLAAL